MKRWQKVGVALGVTVLIAYAGSWLNLGGGVRENVFAQSGKTWVIAHQGGEGLWPSNTLFAFDRAAKLGAGMLDTDLHATKDGQLVAIHDASVNRTTEGKGLVKDMTLAQLKGLDAGYRFTLDGGKTFPFRGLGVSVPTLQELFEAHPDTTWTIEIKQDAPPIAVPFCEALRRFHMTGKVIVASFKDSAMQAFRGACPEVLTSMTGREIRPLVLLNLLGLGGWFRPAGASLQVPVRAAGLEVVTPRFMDVAARKHLSVQPWTINDPAEMRRLVKMGVNGINTDRPDVLLGVLGR